MRAARSLRLLARSAPLCACACALAVACGFPDITFGPSDGGPGLADVTPEAAVGTDGASGADATGSNATGPDAATVDAAGVDAPATDAARSADAAPSDAAAMDSESADDAGPDAKPDAQSDGDSATDGPPDANLDAGSNDSGGAANCDCDAASLYPTGITSCGILGSGLICTQSGFVHQPACGESDDFITCTMGLSCKTTHSTKVQQCQ